MDVVVAGQGYVGLPLGVRAAEAGQALAIVDASVVLDIYPAREDPIPRITSTLIIDAAVPRAPPCAPSTTWPPSRTSSREWPAPETSF
ncbi:hypothetical protein GCM10010324_10490 [Streptomyces hiroshimensis]|uniref:UDP-glucose/GDP-mannose dehydrogenase N-terminal domain-containing protein n=1 Tax=Streptomyces hiroshimensis TaxID=66424 RepID=A0ABQ2Y5X4_9ACTN|nr:hypothetical protein GCM10010324_10490 [Streptomyces hiroshimensis]